MVTGQLALEPEADMLLAAAELVHGKLLKHGGGEFSGWLRTIFEKLKPVDRTVIDALAALNVPLVTTNYDDLITNATGLKPVTWKEPGIVTRVVRGDDRRVLHLHGHWEVPDSVVLGIRSYEAVKQNEHTQAVLKAFGVTKSFLFVGCGDEGLADPNFGNFLSWLAAFEADARVEHRHYRLVRSTEDVEQNGRVFPLVYGDNYSKLPVFLKKLCPQPVKPSGGNKKGKASRRPVFPPDYAAWLAKKCSDDVELSGLRPKHGQAVTLRNVYVPVITRGGEIELEFGKKQKRLRGGALPEHALPKFAMPGMERPEHQLLQALAAEKSLYLSGPPGSGKTTFCRWLTLAVCTGELPLHPIAPPDSFQETFPEPLRGRLPLLIRLREFWEALPKSVGGVERTWAELEKVLEQWVSSKKFDGLSWSVVKDHLDAGTALLIFDGVDEVPLTVGDSQRPAQPRALLLAMLADGVAHWTAVGNRVLVTSRPYGLTDQQRQRLALPHAPLAELPRELQELLVRRWFHCLRKDGTEAETACGELWTDVSARPEIAELAANPLMLTAICIVYGESLKLPEDEFDLYDRIVNRVLFNRYPENPTLANVAHSRLCVIAHGMHTGEELGEPRDQPRPEVTVDEIDRMLQYYQDHRQGRELQKLSASEAREELLSQSGLLLPQGDDRRASFYHFTFQDFLAAERLYDLHADHLSDVFQKRGEFAEWRKALALLYGALPHKRSTSDLAVRLLTEQIETLTDDRLRLGIVLADCWRVLRRHGQTLDANVQQKFVEFCVRALQRETPLKERVELAMALGRIGDTRVVTDLSNPEAWVTVPAGTYRIGDDNKQDYEWRTPLKAQKFRVKQPFQLSKYPITKGQYAQFIAEDGYRNREWWSDAGWAWRDAEQRTEPDYWRDPKWNGETQPVIGVTWWEADAFCSWGQMPPADRTRMGSRRARTTRLGLSLGQRVA